MPGDFLFVPHSNVEILKSEVPRIFLNTLPPNRLNFEVSEKIVMGTFHASSSQPPALQELLFGAQSLKQLRLPPPAEIYGGITDHGDNFLGAQRSYALKVIYISLNLFGLPSKGGPTYGAG